MNNAPIPIDLQTVTQAIAAALGGEWTYEPGEYSHYTHLRRADGLALFLRLRDKRLQISPDSVEAQDENDTRQIYHYDIPSITVGPDRPAAAIAKDLTARLLPDAEAWYDKALAWQATMREHAAASKMLRAQLATYPGASVSHINNGHIYGNGWTAEIHPGSTTLTFRGLPDAKLLRLLDAFHEETMQHSKQQPDMFPTGDDLPIFTGALVKATMRPLQPQPSQAQAGLLDLRPAFGQAEPTYAAQVAGVLV